MTFVETLNMTQSVDFATLMPMPGLDFRSPFDELAELRALLTAGEIAELTGLRRETISRARPDSRFRSRTERALADLYAVVARIRATGDGDPGQLGPILRRPQPLFDGSSIADLLRDGRVDEILDQLVPAEPPRGVEGLEDLHLDAAALASLSRIEQPTDESRAAADSRVARFLGEDDELARLLPTIESRIRDHFGADSEIRRAVVAEGDDVDGRDHLYLRVRTGLSFDAEIDRLTQLLDGEEELLRPVRDRLTIGTL
jgi:hypothetical protein